jgi:hypothetical protein
MDIIKVIHEEEDDDIQLCRKYNFCNIIPPIVCASLKFISLNSKEERGQKERSVVLWPVNIKTTVFYSADERHQVSPKHWQLSATLHGVTY